MIKLLYPDVRSTSEKAIMVWANDACANNESDHAPYDLQDALATLEYLGHITVVH